MAIPVDRSARIPRFVLLTILLCAGALIVAALLNGQTPAKPKTAAVSPREFFDTYCITCHDKDLRTAGLALDTLDVTKPGERAEIRQLLDDIERRRK